MVRFFVVSVLLLPPTLLQIAQTQMRRPPYLTEIVYLKHLRWSSPHTLPIATRPFVCTRCLEIRCKDPDGGKKRRKKRKTDNQTQTVVFEEAKSSTELIGMIHVYSSCLRTLGDRTTISLSESYFVPLAMPPKRHGKKTYRQAEAINATLRSDRLHRCLRHHAIRTNSSKAPVPANDDAIGLHVSGDRKSVV